MSQSSFAKRFRDKFHLEFSPKEDILGIVLVTVACFIQSAAMNAFYVPHGFLSGGVTGLSLLFEYALDIPPSISLLVMNVPICIVTIIVLDLKYALFSVLGTIMFSVAMAVTKFISIPVDPMLAAIFGGAIIGGAGAPVVKHNATLGGMDVVALMLNRRYSISIGTINIIFNAIIMSVLGFLYGLELTMLSIITMFISNMAFNSMLMGLNRTHTVFIISDMWDEIAPEVMSGMNRGVTYIPAEGAYTGMERKLVYCIVKTVELARLKQIVMKHDKNAMFSVIDTKQVIGRGFGAIN